MTNTLESITFSPKNGQPPKALIVTLHGWGASAEDVASLLPFFDLPDYQFVFPDAPFPYAYASEGKAWYDLRMENMYQGLAESRLMLINWLESLESSTGIPLSQTILSGFSQGGAMTLDVGLNLPVAGLVSMSGYLHPGAGIVNVSQATSLPPVLIMHGRQDTVVPLQAALKVKETLESLGVALQYHEFDMGHEITPEMLVVFRNFVAQREF